MHNVKLVDSQDNGQSADRRATGVRHQVRSYGIMKCVFSMRTKWW